MTWRRLTRGPGSDEGSILVLSAFLMVLLFAAVAFAVDIASKSQDRADLWASSDAAALAGASILPDDPAGAKAEALKFALANDPDLAGKVDATFRCVVGDRDGNGLPDPLDVPLSCNPGPPPPAPPTLSGFVCADGVCAAPCDPDLGHRCNTIVLETEKTTEFSFSPVIGIDSGDTRVISAACRGICAGALTEPVDLIMIIDRTGSMSSGSKMSNARNAALAVLDFFDPALQHVGVAFLPAADPLNLCTSNADQTSGGRWLAVGLSNDYKNAPLDVDFDLDGVNDLTSTSPLVRTIRCSTPSGWTNLGSPINDTAYGMPDALRELTTNGRPGVKKGIIMLSDGEANRPLNRPDACLFAANMAQNAKNAGVEVFTIGFGVVGLTCEGPFETAASPYLNRQVSRLLADMASNNADDNCAAPVIENTDGDNFFCEPSGGSLAEVFLAAAAQLAGGSQLIQLPPGA